MPSEVFLVWSKEDVVRREVGEAEIVDREHVATSEIEAQVASRRVGRERLHLGEAAEIKAAQVEAVLVVREVEHAVDVVAGLEHEAALNTKVSTPVPPVRTSFPVPPSSRSIPERPLSASLLAPPERMFPKPSPLRMSAKPEPEMFSTELKLSPAASPVFRAVFRMSTRTPVWAKA